MNQQETQIIPISEDGQLVYNNWDMLTMISKKVIDSGITKVGNPAQINLIILKGKRLGLDLFESLENIIVIGNKTSINGALASALVERSGLLVDKSVVYEGEGADRKCSVIVQRKGRSKAIWSFSIKEARQANLYPGRPGSGWSTYPDSMLYWRALGFCFRREFSDVLQGCYLSEELQDEATQSVREIKVVPVPAPPTAPGPLITGGTAPDPDPADTAKAMASPIIAEPSILPEAWKPVAEKAKEQAKEDKPDPKEYNLERLRALADMHKIPEQKLVEIVNELRLFPRGIEHKLENLPALKVATLVKNWSTVLKRINGLGKNQANG